MADAKFSRGPWGLDVGFDSSPGDFDKYWQVHDGHDAIACSANCSAGNREANAHLIAAAPELYQSLVDLVYSAEYLLNFSKSMSEFEGNIGVEQGCIDRARAALAKARGETP